MMKKNGSIATFDLIISIFFKYVNFYSFPAIAEPSKQNWIFILPDVF